MDASNEVNGARRRRRHRPERARLSPMPPTPCTGLNAAVAKRGLPPVIPIRISTLHKTEATTRPQAAGAQGSKAASPLSNVAAGRPR
jgi:hypothetical protein